MTLFSDSRQFQFCFFIFKKLHIFFLLESRKKVNVWEKKKVILIPTLKIVLRQSLCFDLRSNEILKKVKNNIYLQYILLHKNESPWHSQTENFKSSHSTVNKRPTTKNRTLHQQVTVRLVLRVIDRQSSPNLWSYARQN